MSKRGKEANGKAFEGVQVTPGDRVMVTEAFTDPPQARVEARDA